MDGRGGIAAGQGGLPGLRVGRLEPRLARTRSLGRPADQALRYVKGDRASLLARMGISTVADCLAAVPARYMDFSQLTTVLAAPIGDEVTVVVRIDSVRLKRPRPRLSVVEVGAYDDTGTIILTYFGQPWMEKRFVPGQTVAFSGKVGFSFGFKRMNSPFAEVLADPPRQGDGGPGGAAGHASPAAPAGAPAGQATPASQAASSRVIPVYHTTEGLSAAWARRIAAAAVADHGDVCDWWPPQVRLDRGLMSLSRALRCAHAPHDLEEAEQARRRLAYDEAVFLQLGLTASRQAKLPGVSPVSHFVAGPASRRLAEALPFPLTDDQRAAVKDALSDMAAATPMYRLLLGDVGTGKTMVATCLLGAVADTGTQAAIMAPTGVLAEQYAAKVGPLLDRAGISWSLLTGSTPSGERARIVADVRDGACTVLFGTHALLDPEVSFRALSLVVIDEQQRFGVEQRHALREKGRGADLLVMTATPIPRTLALSLYGDMDVSRITQRPNPGAGVTTKVIGKRQRGLAYDAMREEIARGRQAYVVCPLIGTKAQDEDSEVRDDAARRLSGGQDPSDAHAAEVEAETLQRTVFPDVRVGLLTGRMSPAEKHRVMGDFRAGRISVLVSTTVIEVGVDVSNATVMLIEDGERFGLAQLHQLRGRVGRGDWPGTVFVATGGGSKASRDRLQALERTSDGFSLAEEDLKIRREGELLGSRQSGDVSLRYVDLASDADLLAAARQDARALLEKDPNLGQVQNRPARDELFNRHGDVFREVSGG